jgi:hypothetical protein
MSDDLVCAHFSLARSCLVCELEAELAAERARADRAEENQSNAERIARVWMETAKKAEAELTEVRRDAEQFSYLLSRAVDMLHECGLRDEIWGALEDKP